MIVSGRYASRTLHPRLVAIVVSKRDNEVCGCPVAWFTPVNRDPLMIAVSLAPTRYTYSLIMKSHEFTLNIPPYSVLDKVHYIGTRSCRNEPDKLLKAGFRLKPSRIVRSPGIEGCLTVLECKLEKAIEFSDHHLLIARVLHVEADDKFFTPERGYSEDAKPIYHACSNIYTTTNGYRIV